MKFINFCLSIPNLDTIIFYVIFVIIIPAYLFGNSDFETLKYYLPALIMIAITLTEAGAPNLFVNLYPNPCDQTTNFSGFLSSNVINGMAVVGILAQSLVITMATSSITLGLVSGLITFGIAFPMAQQILPFFIREVNSLSVKITTDPTRYNMLFPGNWHLYVAGLLFTLLLLGTQYIMLIGFTRYILSSGIELI
jgi:hypothetical protein